MKFHLRLTIILLLTSNVPLAFAKPYFCSAPAVARLAVPTEVDSPLKSESPSRSMPSAELASYLDPLLFKAVLWEFQNPDSTEVLDFSTFIKNVLLKRGWRKVSGSSRTKLLENEKYREIILAHRLTDIPGKAPFFSSSLDQFKEVLLSNGPPLTRFLNTKTVLDFLLSLSRDQSRSLAPALAYLCIHFPDLTLDIPHPSNGLNEMKIQIAQIEAENVSQLNQILEKSFPLTPPNSIYGQDLGNFLRQIKDLDLMAEWPKAPLQSGEKSSTGNKFDQLKKNVLFLSKAYQDKVTTLVKNEMENKLWSVGQFIMSSRESIDHFQAQKEQFMERLTQLYPSQVEVIQNSLPTKEEPKYAALQHSEPLKNGILALEAGLQWRQSVKLLSSFESHVRQLYLSYFYFEEDTGLKQNISKDLSSVRNSSRTDEGARQEFSLATTFDQLLDFEGNEIVLFPWFKFSAPSEKNVPWYKLFGTKEEVLESEKQKCHIKKKGENQIKVRCFPKFGYLGSYEKLITIPKKSEYASLAIFLSDLLKNESQTIRYLKLYSKEHLDTGTAFLEVLKAKKNNVNPHDYQHVLDEWEGSLLLEQKICLDEIASIIQCVEPIQEKIRKYTELAEESSKMLVRNASEAPPVKGWIEHLGNIVTMMNQDLETNVFPETKVSPKLKLELWNEMTRKLFLNVSTTVYFQVESGTDWVQTTLLDYIRYLILMSLDLHEKPPLPLTKKDSFVLGVDALAEKFHSFATRNQAASPFTRKYILHSISRFGELFSLEPKAEDRKVVKSLQRSFQQMLDLYKMIKKESDQTEMSGSEKQTPETQSKDALEKFKTFQLEILKLKESILAVVLSEIKQIPELKSKPKSNSSFQAVLRTLAEREVNELFHNSNKLSHMMEIVHSQKHIRR